jgi:Flp pilus assembly protein TadG
MKRMLRAWRDERGVAAIEFARIIPNLVALVVLGLDGWLRINQISQMRSALQTGSRYYQGGGSDDTAAAQLALQSWMHAPPDAGVNTSRACSCAGVGASCSSQCANNTLPSVYVTLTATGTPSSLIQSQMISESGVVRVR